MAVAYETELLRLDTWNGLILKRQHTKITDLHSYFILLKTSPLNSLFGNSELASYSSLK